MKKDDHGKKDDRRENKDDLVKKEDPQKKDEHQLREVRLTARDAVAPRNLRTLQAQKAKVSRGCQYLGKDHSNR